MSFEIIEQIKQHSNISQLANILKDIEKSDFYINLGSKPVDGNSLPNILAL
jgi:hypothetical protein